MWPGDFPALPPPGEGRPPNRRDGEYTGVTFPSWGDPDGYYGQVTILRLEAAVGDLPRNPFLIRKSVERVVGAKITEAYPEKRGLSYVLKLRNKKQIDTLKGMKELDDGFKIKIAEHPVLNLSKCVISCAESTEFTETEIKDSLKDQGVCDLRRTTKFGGEGKDRLPTPTLILTINGTVIPENIDFGWIRCRTRPYYPSPMLCFGCYDYGHTKARCQKTTPTCGNCSGDHINAPATPCQEKPYCKQCKKDDHAVSSRKCPTYEKEVAIQHIRVDMGVSYPTARRTYDQQNRQHTAAAVVGADTERKLAEMNTKLDRVLTELDKKNEENAALKAAMVQKDVELEECYRRIAALEATLGSLAGKPTPAPRDTDTPATVTKQPSSGRRGGKGSKDSGVNRLELTRQHGTIEDLVTEIQALRQKDTLQKKVIETLRQGQNNNIHLPSPKPTNTVARNPPKSQVTKTTSTDSTETAPKRSRCRESPITIDDDNSMEEDQVTSTERINDDFNISSEEDPVDSMVASYNIQT